MKKIIIIFFTIMVLVQIAVPVQMIFQRENTLQNGELFLFETAPVDPFDAFRGRYVALNFKQGTFEVDNKEFKRGSYIYVTIKAEADGVASLAEPTVIKPIGHTYLKVRVRYNWGEKLSVVLPFDRFYMDEYKAYDAEKLYRERNSRVTGTKSQCFAKVRVLGGFSVLVDLVIDGKGIKESLQDIK